MVDEWSDLADLLANLIAKYADQLDLDHLPDSKAPVQKESLDAKEKDSKDYSTSSIEKTEAA